MQRQVALDGLRGCAVAAVVAFHICDRCARGGWVGVDVFFVLSGFLITALLRAELGARGRIDLRNFYMRRVLRLLPAFAGLMLFELSRAALCPKVREEILASVGYAGGQVMNWNRAFGWGPQGVLGHSWSLSMEEQFYLLWPAALLLIWRRRPLVWISAAIVAIGVWRAGLALQGVRYERIYNGFDTRADALLLGCLLAFAVLPPRVEALARRAVVLPVLVLVLMVFGVRQEGMFTHIVGLSVSAVCAGWVMLVACQPGVLNRLLSWRWLVAVGQISYGWYLWHYPLLRLGEAWVGPIGKLVGALLGLGVAVVSYQRLERPILALKRHFGPRGAARSAAGGERVERPV